MEPRESPYSTNTAFGDTLQAKNYIFPDLEQQYALLWNLSKACKMHQFWGHLTACS